MVLRLQGFCVSLVWLGPLSKILPFCIGIAISHYVRMMLYTFVIECVAYTGYMADKKKSFSKKLLALALRKKR
ncbi:hypothetical protein BH23PAT2_BH23PAT2_08540 [soil metagenome]